MSDTFKLANSLASDLAENYLRGNMADMMMIGCREKAKAIRQLSEANTDQLSKTVQEYRRDQRAIYSALYNLIEGYGGYRIIKEG